MKTQCMECQKNLVGRSDKKFCDVHCKNAYHNGVNKNRRAYLGMVNNQALHNFRILEQLWHQDRDEVHRSHLEKEGYYFERSTEIQFINEHQVAYFCFNLGIKPLENGYFAIANKEETDS